MIWLKCCLKEFRVTLLVGNTPSYMYECIQIYASQRTALGIDFLLLSEFQGPTELWLSRVAADVFTS